MNNTRTTETVERAADDNNCAINNKTGCLGVTFTLVLSGGDALEVDDAQVQSFLEPDPVHDPDHLQSQHVLPQVLPDLDQTNTNR